jgi:hypothetical protein
MSTEEEAQALFKQWQAQQNAMMGSGGQNFGDPNLGTDQSPHLFENANNPTGPDQSPVNPINSVRPMGAPPTKAPPQAESLGNVTRPPSSPGTTPTPAQMPDVCKECGTMHPPVAAGQKCPNARVATKTDGNPLAIDDATINKHLVDMRNIIMSNISSKGIKDQRKFFQHAIVELTKCLESYNE